MSASGSRTSEFREGMADLRAGAIVDPLLGSVRVISVNFQRKQRLPLLRSPKPDLDGLLREVGLGDETAFEALYGATVDRCFGLVRAILGDRAWAEDCVADIYTQVWRNALDFDSAKGSATAWLLMISRTRAIDLLRRERCHRATPLTQMTRKLNRRRHPSIILAACSCSIG